MPPTGGLVLSRFVLKHTNVQMILQSVECCLFNPGNYLLVTGEEKHQRKTNANIRVNSTFKGNSNPLCLHVYQSSCAMAFSRRSKLVSSLAISPGAVRIGGAESRSDVLNAARRNVLNEVSGPSWLAHRHVWTST